MSMLADVKTHTLQNNLGILGSVVHLEWGVVSYHANIVPDIDHFAPLWTRLGKPRCSGVAPKKVNTRPRAVCTAALGPLFSSHLPRVP